VIKRVVSSNHCAIRLKLLVGMKPRISERALTRRRVVRKRSSSLQMKFYPGSTQLSNTKRRISRSYTISPMIQRHGGIHYVKSTGDLEGEYDLSGECHLGEEVTSRSETQFAQFMKALNATEWVKQGHADYVVGHDERQVPVLSEKVTGHLRKGYRRGL
jgi:hypothetical protein